MNWFRKRLLQLATLMIFLAATFPALSECLNGSKKHFQADDATVAHRLKPKGIRVRVTFYTGQSGRWGRCVAWQGVDRAKAGRTVAADPAIFPFGTWIDIPGFGKRRVEDTGPGLKSRTASGGKEPVIDIYVEEVAELAKLVACTAPYAEITLP